MTVIVAAVVVAVPVELVNTARNFVPFCPASTFGTVNVVVIAPATLLKLAPPFVLNCHCTVGAGVPDAAAVNVAVCPALTVASVGFCVIAGAWVTVSVAAVVVAEPTVLVNTARNWLPFCATRVVNVNVVLVAPAMFENVAPPLVLSCHCTVGVGLPLAAAVNDTMLPAAIV